jgi:hypothetical protein
MMPAQGREARTAFITYIYAAPAVLKRCSPVRDMLMPIFMFTRKSTLRCSCFFTQ